MRLRTRAPWDLRSKVWHRRSLIVASRDLFVEYIKTTGVLDDALVRNVAEALRRLDNKFLRSIPPAIADLLGLRRRRLCTRCGEFKAGPAFARRGGGRKTTCRSCHAKWWPTARANRREKRRRTGVYR